MSVAELRVRSLLFGVVVAVVFVGVGAAVVASGIVGARDVLMEKGGKIHIGVLGVWRRVLEGVSLQAAFVLVIVMRGVELTMSVLVMA